MALALGRCVVCALFLIQLSAPLPASAAPSSLENASASDAEGTWATRADMPTARSGLGVAAVNGKIYAIGGDGLSTVEELDPAGNTWATRASMPAPRSSLAATTANGKVYAIGGFSSDGYLSTVEEYDPLANTWAARASMPTARSGLGVATAANGKIYAIGGYDGSDYSNKVEEYNPLTNTWASRAPMPTPRTAGAAAASNGKIYAVGGIGPGGPQASFLSTLEEYDPATDTWTTQAPMPTARVPALVAASNGKLYALGGRASVIGPGGALFRVEEYDPATNTWVRVADMPTPRVSLGAAEASNGKLYAIGGSWLTPSSGGPIPQRANEELTPAASLAGSPNPVPFGFGLGTSTIFWGTGDGSVGEVWVDDTVDETPEMLFARGVAGSQDAPWIQLGHFYQFGLYRGVSHTERLLTIQVTRPGPPQRIVANPSVVPTGSGLGTTTISWDTREGVIGEVWVDVLADSAGEVLFARGIAGIQDAPWIQSGGGYRFTLYRGTGREVMLADVQVTRG